MANEKIKFIQGAESSYDTTTYANALWFSPTTKQLILDGVRYIPKKISELVNDANYLTNTDFIKEKNIDWQEDFSAILSNANTPIDVAMMFGYNCFANAYQGLRVERTANGTNWVGWLSDKQTNDLLTNNDTAINLSPTTLNVQIRMTFTFGEMKVYGRLRKLYINYSNSGGATICTIQKVIEGSGFVDYKTIRLRGSGWTAIPIAINTSETSEIRIVISKETLSPIVENEFIIKGIRCVAETLYDDSTNEIALNLGCPYKYNIVDGILNFIETTSIANIGDINFGNSNGKITTNYGQYGNTWITLSNDDGVYIDGKLDVAQRVSDNVASDIRLKKDFNHNIDYRKRILQIGRVCDFNYTTDAIQKHKGNADNNTHTSIIWQDAVKAEIPNLCSVDNDGFGKINSLCPDLTFTTIGALQQNIEQTNNQRKEIDVLKKRIIALEKEINKLKKQK